MSRRTPEEQREWRRTKYQRDPGHNRRNKVWADTHRDEIREKARVVYGGQMGWYNALKAGPCMDCGVQYPPCVMDFDHRPDEIKEMNVGSMMGQSMPKARILAEIAKCDLVCANCHRMRTAARRAGLIRG